MRDERLVTRDGYRPELDADAQFRNLRGHGCNKRLRAERAQRSRLDRPSPPRARPRAANSCPSGTDARSGRGLLRSSRSPVGLCRAAGGLVFPHSRGGTSSAGIRHRNADHRRRQVGLPGHAGLRRPRAQGQRAVHEIDDERRGDSAAVAPQQHTSTCDTRPFSTPLAPKCTDSRPSSHTACPAPGRRPARAARRSRIEKQHRRYDDHERRRVGRQVREAAVHQRRAGRMPGRPASCRSRMPNRSSSWSTAHCSPSMIQITAYGLEGRAARPAGIDAHACSDAPCTAESRCDLPARDAGSGLRRGVSTTSLLLPS